MMNDPASAAIAPRQGFLPPTVPLTGQAGDPVTPGVGPVSLLAGLSDRMGEQVADPATRVHLGCSDGCLRLHVVVWDGEPWVDPAAEVGTAAFFAQDAIEWWLLPDPVREDAKRQIVIAADGRCFDSVIRAAISAVSVRAFEAHGGAWLGGPDDPATRGWGIETTLPLTELGLDPEHPPAAIDGLVVRVLGREGGSKAAVSSPTPLAFNQADRYGRWLLPKPGSLSPPVGLLGLRFASPTLRLGAQTATAEVHNPSETPVHGRLHVELARDGLTPVRTVHRVELPPGAGMVPIGVNLDRPTYTRVSLCFEDAAGMWLLGAMTLRAAALPLSRGFTPPVRDPGESGHPTTGDFVAPLKGESVTGIVQTGGAGPRLLAEPSVLGNLRQKRDHPLLGRVRQTLLAHGNEKKNQANDEADAQVFRDLGRLSVAFLLGADDTAPQQADALVHDAIGPSWQVSYEGQGHLHFGMRCATLALAYDALGRAADATAGWRRLTHGMLDAYLHEAQRRDWATVANPNANAVVNGGGGSLALALLGEHDGAEDALTHAVTHLTTFLDYCGGPDGGNTEGAQYWDYGLTRAVRFAWLRERVTGCDDGLLSHPTVQKLTAMIELGLCPDGAMHGVNDTIPMPVGAELAWFAAGRFGDRLGLWYADHAWRHMERREAEGKPTPYKAASVWAVLFRPDVPESFDAPPAPRSVHLPSIEYTTLRSEPAYHATWLAGTKGSRPPYTHHNQSDTGAVHVHLQGERLLIDPGYYKGQATDHALPLIDGVGPKQPGGYVGRIAQRVEREAGVAVVCDSTAAYGQAARRVRRLLVVLSGGPVVLLDDVVSADQTAGNVTAQYPFGGRPTPLTGGEPGGAAVRIQGQAAVMRVDLFGPASLSLSVHDQRPLHDTHWGYRFADCELHPVTAAYAADAARPLISVFQDDSDAAATRPRVQREGELIRVQLADARELVFAHGDEGWLWL